MNTSTAGDVPRRPPLALSILVCVAAVALWGLIRLVVFHDVIMPLTYALPLMICLWTRDRRLLWGMAAVFYVMAAAKLFWIMPKNALPSLLDWEVFISQVVNISVAGVVVHALLGAREKLERKNADLEQSNRELSELNEEVHSQGEELAQQTEELRQQTEELSAQGEELHQQAESLQVANEELARREEMMRALLAVAGPLPGRVNILDEICRKGISVLGGRATGSAVLQPHGDEIRLMGFAGELDGEPSGSKWPLEESLAGIVLEQGRTLAINDLALRPDIHVPKASRAEFRALLATPLRLADGLLGVMEFYSVEKHEWTEDEFRLAEWVAARCCVFLESYSLRKKLQENEERLRLALSSGRMGTWEWELESGRIEWSQVTFELFGYVPGTIKPDFDAWRTRIHPEDVQAAEAVLQQAVTSEDPYWGEYRVVRPDGTIAWMEARGEVLPGGGAEKRMYGIVTDVTERKQVEEGRRLLLEAERAARAEAEKVNRLKDEFLATVSHELRTPLNAIIGWSRLLMAGKAGETHRALEIIDRSASSLVQLVEDLLDTNKVISGKIHLNPELSDLGLLVRRAVQSIQPAATAKSLHLSISIDPSLRSVLCDSNRVQQILWNLLMNAIKFTPPRGQIEVAARQGEDGVTIVVSDTGQGIRPDFIPHIFERFRQGDGSVTRRHGGLGLGLSIVKHLVELHGGTVSVESDGPGKGARFTVSLPSESAGEGPGRHEPAEPARPSAPAARVVLVDDDNDTRQLVARVLLESGIDVHPAMSADEGFHLTMSLKPDVLISDIGMPGEDGYQFIGRIRSQGGWCATLPSIALSALARDQDRDRALAAGYDRHVAKPFEPNALAVLIKSLLPRNGANNAPGSVSRPATILVAEDDPSTVELLRSCLEMQGYSVVAAETVDGALQEAATRRIDLLLSDHLLEDGNGVDLLRKLRETRKLPAIMMTGRTETALQEQCRRAGFDAFIVKPVDIDALVARVADLLGSARDGSAPVQADTAGHA